MKSVRIAVDTTGRPAEDYQVTGLYLSPETIDVAGSEEALSGISVIRLPDIDIAGMDSNIIKTFDIGDYLPDGVRIVGGTDTVTATVTLERNEEKNIVIPADSITDNGTTPEGLTAHIESEDIEITVSGPAGKLELVDGVNAYVDLSGYEAGTYEDVPVVIELPDDVSMTSETVGVTVVLS